MVGPDPNPLENTPVEPAEPAGDTAPPVEPTQSAVVGLRTDDAPGAEPSLAKSAQEPEELEDVTEEQDDDLLTSVRKNAPPWLVSSMVHSLVLIILGLWVIPFETESRMMLESTLAERLGEQLEVETFEFNTPDEMLVQEQILTPQDLPEVENPLAVPSEADIVTLQNSRATSPLDAPTIGLALSGREKGMKEALLKAFGGDATTETAVLNGLKWLVRQQRRNGSWSLVGPYPGGGFNENDAAATAMALLAFQGAGYTHLGSPDEPFTKVVTRGWSWLLKQLDEDGNFFHRGPNQHRLYTQAQCTIALCELYGMTRDEAYREPAQRAIDYLVRTQDSEGGWRYSPGIDSDTSVTGWVVMALQSARMAYLNVPEETFFKVTNYLDRASVDGGRRYVYKPGWHESMAMTAEGLLCRQYLGWERNDPRLLDGVDLITDNFLLSWDRRDVYYWYYATQVCHHMEGEPWKKWNRVMRQLIPEKQERRGPQRGSWDPRGDEWGSRGGGRLFVTCLSIYMLEVYYRHLPLYRQKLFEGGS